jgi:hypothetical protein
MGLGQTSAVNGLDLHSETVSAQVDQEQQSSFSRTVFVFMEKLVWPDQHETNRSYRAAKVVLNRFDCTKQKAP